MNYKYINYNNLINRITKEDKLFHGDYIIDPYQNCEFGCKYCDSSYENVVYIKNSFLEKTREEIKNLPNGNIIIGSVIDPYQNIEKKLKLTRNLLKILKEYNFNIHILTKSDLILRDIDILSQIKNLNITLSIISLNKKITEFFEEKVPSPVIRLKIIEKMSEKGIKTGLAIIPILPFIIEEEIEDIIKLSLKHKSRYLLYKFLQLKGFQKNIFYHHLKHLDNSLVEKYENLYTDNYEPDTKYTKKINDEILMNCKKYGISNNIL